MTSWLLNLLLAVLMVLVPAPDRLDATVDDDRSERSEDSKQKSERAEREIEELSTVSPVRVARPRGRVVLADHASHRFRATLSIDQLACADEQRRTGTSERRLI